MFCLIVVTGNNRVPKFQLHALPIVIRVVAILYPKVRKPKDNHTSKPPVALFYAKK